MALHSLGSMPGLAAETRLHQVAIPAQRLPRPFLGRSSRTPTSAASPVQLTTSSCTSPTAIRRLPQGQHQRLGTMAAVAEPASSAQADPQPSQEDQPSYICTSVTASTIDAFLAEIKEAEAAGVDIVELRLDFLKDFDPELHLERLLKACTLPYIVTYRPTWEG